LLLRRQILLDGAGTLAVCWFIETVLAVRAAVGWRDGIVKAVYSVDTVVFVYEGGSRMAREERRAIGSRMVLSGDECEYGCGQV
jgi:hypothetical protein